MKRVIKTVGLATIMLLTITATMMLAIGMIGEKLKEFKLQDIKISQKLCGIVDRYLYHYNRRISFS